MKIGEYKKHPAQITIEEYIEYWNEHNKEKVLSRLTPWWSTINANFDDLYNTESMKIISIEEINEFAAKKSYLETQGAKKQNVKEENLKIYKVQLEVKLKDEKASSLVSGIYEWRYYVIRKDASSPWLIDEYGS